MVWSPPRTITPMAFCLLVLSAIFMSSMFVSAANGALKSPLSSTCGYGFGMGYNSDIWNYSKEQLPFTHISIWLKLGEVTKAGLTPRDSNGNLTPPTTREKSQWWEGEHAKLCKNTGITPLVTAYIIAGLGHYLGYKDCNVNKNGNNLCTHGAKLIRDHWDYIIQTYDFWAEYYAEIIGKDAVMLWNIEPDYTQYSESSGKDQIGGGIPDKDLAGKYLSEIIATIKKHLPNAKIGADISPWWNERFETWGKLMDLNQIDYFAVSGTEAQPFSDKIKPGQYDKIQYSDIPKWFNRPVHVDIGYGTEGVELDISKWMYGDNGWVSMTTVPARSGNGIFGLTAQRGKDNFKKYIAEVSKVREKACEWSFGVDRAGGNEGGEEGGSEGGEEGGNEGGKGNNSAAISIAFLIASVVASILFF